jgi:LAO/AO transport system kinase
VNLPANDEALSTGVCRGERRSIAKAITLLESTRADHRARADALLNDMLSRTGRAVRIGISGVPGVGKSTFVEALGLALIARGHRVAVLAIDPSSSVNGGSILGDKTRMEQLSVHPSAFIRPSPAAGTLGGVAEKTREAMLVCEAAGFDRVLVETVGVGQSETAVAGMTDLFVVLQLPNAGDDLQAIKKGVMELADLVVINKADIDPVAAARAQSQIAGSLRLLAPRRSSVDAATAGERWSPVVMPLSALKGEGLDAFIAQVDRFTTLRQTSGEWTERRQQQAQAWMWDLIQARLQSDFKRHPAVRQRLPELLDAVKSARIAPSAAARALLADYADTQLNPDAITEGH